MACAQAHAFAYPAGVFRPPRHATADARRDAMPTPDHVESSPKARAEKSKYKRILLKLSGEALMGEHDFGIDPKVLDRMALEIGQLVGIGVQVGIVIGGGNLFRGAALNEAGMDRVTGDHMGMLATVMNALAMRDALERSNIRSRDRKSTRLNSSHVRISYAVFCLKKKK